MPLAIDERVFEVVALDEADDRAEDFFLGDAHVGFYFAEDGGREEPVLWRSAFGEPCASGDEFCAFRFGDGDVAFGGFDLLLVDLRADLVGFVEAVADFERLSASY